MAPVCPNCSCGAECDAIAPLPCVDCGADCTEFDRPPDGFAWRCDDCLRANAWQPAGPYKQKQPTDWWSLVPLSVREELGVG